jgi:hypothetical protein
MVMNEWFNENENRMYPLAEYATGIANSGAAMPFGLVCDLVVTGPVNLLYNAGTQAAGAYVSMLTITPVMVSISIASHMGGLVAGSWKRPITPYQPMALQPVATGVSGYVVFGMMSEDLQSARYLFSGPGQSALDMKSMRMLEPAAVTSVCRYGSPAQKLVGTVKLEFSPDLVWNYQPPGIDPDYPDGIIQVGLAANKQSAYVGPCDKTGILDQCGIPPIRTINGVQGDSNGIITIEVRN